MFIIPLLLSYGIIKINFEDMTKRYVKFYYSLMTIYAHNTTTLTLIMFMLQIIWRKNEKLDTLASHNCTKDSFLHKFLGVAFSLIVIMLQTNFLLWRVLFGLSPFDVVVVVAVSYYNIIKSII